ncbi:MAG: hypothetical protein A2W99_13300 [Bacteroidetes bacterium GWF2_33_16]|nr:MAG: hypothetical protein A2X00_00975 [Bacteroidetes bacterium GWE2_32_14]OFY06654.1 MAG: hypothetical protein A2W99_13300 [Bacteroidetes bacterium GWF2_33_16]
MRSISLLICILFSVLTYGQNEIKDFSTKKVLLTLNDSTIEANILLKTKKIKLSDNIVYYWYKSNQINSNKGGYIGKLLDGKYIVENRDGDLITSGNFKTGYKTGIWKTWYNNGQIKTIGKYSKGRRVGHHKVYDSFGSLKEINKFKDDKLNGKQVLFVNGTKTIKKYKNGVAVTKKTKDENTNKKDKLEGEGKPKSEKDSSLINKKDEKSRKRLFSKRAYDDSLKVNKESEKESAKKPDAEKIDKENKNKRNKTVKTETSKNNLTQDKNTKNKNEVEKASKENKEEDNFFKRLFKKNEEKKDGSDSDKKKKETKSDKDKDLKKKQ